MTETNQNNRMIPGDILFEWIREELASGRKASFRVTGKSMMPWIVGGRDTVELDPAIREKLHTGDIVLYRTESGHYLLHRITRIHGDRMVTTGDGNDHRDEEAKLTSVIGRVSVIYRKGRRIACDDLHWRAVFRLWMWLYPVRGLVFRRMHW